MDNGVFPILKIASNHPLKSYIYKQLKDLDQKINKLETTGLKLNKEDVLSFSKYFFQGASGPYIGIESNLPSTYFELYPTYLAENEEYLKILTPEERIVTKRILIARSAGDMRTDAIMHPHLYKHFIDWHTENKVGLYWIEEDKAKQIMNKYKTESTDIAYWEQNYAVEFMPNGEKKDVKIKLLRREALGFEKVKKYVEEIIRSSQLLTLDTKKLPILPEEVVQHWDGYIGSLRFRENTIGKILIAELKPADGRILDAAAGSGYETILLAKKGFDVTANELDPVWNAILRKKISEKNIPVEIYQFDWRKLSSYLKPLYAGITVLGNSLCMVIGELQRKQSLEEIYKIMRQNGKLVIDVRNFDLIIKKIKNGEKYFAKGVMYACKKMNAFLSIESEEERLIRFNFFDTSTEKILGSVIVQALKQQELESQLKRIGFRHIKVFSDLKEGFYENADFYTYVATK